ncbi:hypothetical protein P152DRAFT_372257, partial [Eremomyces bilateralis CBS 781.70]
MASSPSKALMKRSAPSELTTMPPPPTKRIKRPSTVLPEDTYTDALSHIIKRDFFPGLLETETQQEFLDAVESRDREWILDAQGRLETLMTPRADGRRVVGRRGVSMTPVNDGIAGETPVGWTGATPTPIASRTPSRDAADRKPEQPEVDLNLSLDAFMAKYTSEDNESFNALLDKQNTKHAEKYRWLYAGNKIPSTRQLEYCKQQASLPPSSTSQSLIRLSHAPDTRPAAPTTRRENPKNTLMFPPDAVEPTTAQAAASASRAAPKSVSYSNTRMPDPMLPSSHVPIPPSPSISAVRDALAGRERRTETEAGSAVDGGGGETPRVGGYAFVDAEATEAEVAAAAGGVAGDEDARTSALLARLRSGADGGRNPFTINEASRREALHHRLVEKAKEKEKGVEGRGAEGRTPGTPGTPRGNLTPAGERLLRGMRTPRREAFEGR